MSTLAPLRSEILLLEFMLEDEAECQSQSHRVEWPCSKSAHWVCIAKCYHAPVLWCEQRNRQFVEFNVPQNVCCGRCHNPIVKCWNVHPV